MAISALTTRRPKLCSRFDNLCHLNGYICPTKMHLFRAPLFPQGCPSWLLSPIPVAPGLFMGSIVHSFQIQVCFPASICVSGLPHGIPYGRKDVLAFKHAGTRRHETAEVSLKQINAHAASFLPFGVSHSAKLIGASGLAYLRASCNVHSAIRNTSSIIQGFTNNSFQVSKPFIWSFLHIHVLISLLPPTYMYVCVS